MSLIDFINDNALLPAVVFFHVLSAIIWIGGMIGMRFAVHFSMQEIDDPMIKIDRTLENLRRFFNIVIPSIIILLLTAIIMVIDFGFKESSLYGIVLIKEGLWAVMTFVFIVVYIKRIKASNAFEKGDLATAKKHLFPIATYFIPLNIFLGIVALFLGVTLRGIY